MSAVAIATLEDEPDAEHQDDERRERELRDRLQADDVGLHDRRVVARPPERQAEQRARGGADQEAEDGRAEGEADVGPGVAGGEEDRERLGDRARLRPEERVDPAGARADLPERRPAHQNADLRDDERPGRPVLLHRQAPDRARRRLGCCGLGGRGFRRSQGPGLRSCRWYHGPDGGHADCSVSASCLLAGGCPAPKRASPPGGAG